MTTCCWTLVGQGQGEGVWAPVVLSLYLVKEQGTQM